MDKRKTVRRSHPALLTAVQRKITEATVKKFLLAAALSSAFITGAMAQTYDPSPRDPPFGKGNPGNDTYHQQSQADLWSRPDSWNTAGGYVTNGEWKSTRSRRSLGAIDR
jgi:hypothetical protein